MLSVIIPIFNESGAICSLAQELDHAFAETDIRWEVIWVDDGSTDDTQRHLAHLRPPQRSITLGHNCGKSAAYIAGLQASRGDWVATLDGDGQDVPADLLALLNEAIRGHADAVIGRRTIRADSFIRKISSRIANGVRRGVLNDRFLDVGCGARVGRRLAFECLPYFSGLHRFIPIFMEQQGFRVLEIPVRNRIRQSGCSKYGIGNRFFSGMYDLLGVRWLLRRRRHWKALMAASLPSQSSTSTPPTT